MKIDSHTPHSVPIGDNRHSPIRLLHEPNTTGVMRSAEHRKAEMMIGRKSKKATEGVLAFFQRQRKALENAVK